MWESALKMHIQEALCISAVDVDVAALTRQLRTLQTGGKVTGRVATAMQWQGVSAFSVPVSSTRQSSSNCYQLKCKCTFLNYLLRFSKKSLVLFIYLRQNSPLRKSGHQPPPGVMSLFSCCVRRQ